jgi:hypothetical protein
VPDAPGRARPQDQREITSGQYPKSAVSVPAGFVGRVGRPAFGLVCPFTGVTGGDARRVTDDADADVMPLGA